MIKIVKYNSEYFQRWNDLITASKNATFLLHRNFMDYHADRFDDNSLLFFKDEKLLAALPANLSSNILYSHQGLSYGGLVLSREIKVQDVLEIFESLKEYCIANSISKLVYKCIPHIYHKYPSDEDLYALFRNNAKLIRRDAAFIIDLSDPEPCNNLRKRSLKKALKNGLTCSSSKNYDEYHQLLSEVLDNNHKTKPVHSAAEMKLLAENFSQNIELICSYKDQKIVSGTWLFLEENVVHTQYIASSQEGRQNGGFELVIDFIQQKYRDKKYLSFGIATENNGQSINAGLVQQKESFGARAICHDFYELNFSA